jgi:hypothetical protein
MVASIFSTNIYAAVITDAELNDWKASRNAGQNIPPNNYDSSNMANTTLTFIQNTSLLLLIHQA